MPNAEEEAAWRAEFEAAGETEVRDRLYSNMYPGEKNSAAFRWLRQQAHARTLREQRAYRITWLTLFVAIAAVIVGIIGVAVTWLGH